MKSISLREFQLHASKYLKELPLVLTQYNISVAKVIPFTEADVTLVLTDNDPSVSFSSSSVNTSVMPLIQSQPISDPELKPEPQNEVDALIAKYPNIKLFGKVRACPFCNESIPVELAQKHYDEKHEGS